MATSARHTTQTSQQARSPGVQISTTRPQDPIFPICHSQYAKLFKPQDLDIGIKILQETLGGPGYLI